MNSFLSLARIDELEMITDDGMVFGPVGGGGGDAFVAGPHPGRVKISVILSCKEQVSDVLFVMFAGCYVSYLSGSAGSRLDSLTIHWECP